MIHQPVWFFIVTTIHILSINLLLLPFCRKLKKHTLTIMINGIILWMFLSVLRNFNLIKMSVLSIRQHIRTNVIIVMLNQSVCIVWHAVNHVSINKVYITKKCIHVPVSNELMIAMINSKQTMTIKMTQCDY